MAMTEEQAARIAAAVKARIAGTGPADPKTGVAPTGGAKPKEAPPADEGMLGNIMASIGGMFGGGNSPTEGTAPAQDNPALSNALNPLANDPISGLPNLDMSPLGMAGKSLTLGRGLLDAMIQGDSGQTEYDPSTSAAVAFGDTATAGGMDKISAGIDTALETGKPVLKQVLDNATAAIGLTESDDEWTKSYEENHYLRSIEQERIRSDNLIASFGGDLAGSLLPGGIIFKGMARGAKALGWEKALSDSWLRRSVFTATAGSAEAVTYRVNKDGDLSQAAVDGSLAFVGGMAFSSMIKSVQGARSLLTTRGLNDAMKESVGTEVIRGINLERQREGLPPVSPADIQKQVDELGPDATLLDMYPTQMQVLAKNLISKQVDERTGETLRDLLAVRNKAMEELMAQDGPLRTTLGAQRLLSTDQFTKVTREQLSALSPKFDEVIKANEDVTFRSGNMIKSVGALFGSTPTQSQRELMAEFAASIRDVQESILKPQKRGVTEIPLRSILDIKRQLQNPQSNVSRRIDNGKRVISKDNIDQRDMQIMIAYLDDMTGSAVEALQPLNKQYGFIASGREAYDAGFKAINNTVDADDFLMRFASQEGARGNANLPAFMEGAKRGLFQKLSKATTAKQIDDILLNNRNTLDKLRGMFGDEVVEGMVGAVKPAVLKIKTAEGLKASIDTIASQGGEISRSLGDLAVMAGGAVGLSGTSLAAGAARRIIPKAMSGGLEAINPERQKLLAKTLTAQGGDAVSTMKELLRLQQGALSGEDINSMAVDLLGSLGANSAINSMTER